MLAPMDNKSDEEEKKNRRKEFAGQWDTCTFSNSAFWGQARGKTVAHRAVKISSFEWSNGVDSSDTKQESLYKKHSLNKIVCP